MPFDARQFFDVFEAYNLDLPFAWIVLSALAVLAVVLAVLSSDRSDVITQTVLIVMWAWSGAVYHILYFAGINPVARVFGVLFLLEAALIGVGLSLGRLSGVKYERTKNGYAGAALIAYSLLLYPILNGLFGHWMPRAPSFGLPCPITIFTLGIFLWNKDRPPWWVMVVPYLWVLIGSSASILFGVWPDLALPLAGIIFAMRSLTWRE